MPPRPPLLWLRAEIMERGQRPCSGYFKNGTSSVRAAKKSCSIKSSIGGLNQTADGVVAIGETEVMQRRQCACRGDLEYRACIVRPTGASSSVKVAVRSKGQARFRENRDGRVGRST